MMHLLFHLIQLLVLFSTGFTGTIFGDECKISVDSRHTELKELLTTHHKFNWNNWSHLILLFNLGLLVCLLLLAYCFIKLKIWPAVKHAHVPSSLTHRLGPTQIIEKPYIFTTRDQPSTTTTRTDATDEP